MANNLKPMTISEILDGRIFMIPSYQRGYRWENKQVDDLLEDLLKFALKDNKQKEEFYCLQPIIVKKISNKDVYKELMPNYVQNDTEIWEVVDGQQRLTTLFILIKYLLGITKLDADEFKEDYGKTLYHILYETRIKDIDFMENLDMNKCNTANNIDSAHISSAFIEMDYWLKNIASNISKKYGGPEAPRKIADELLKLLTNNKDEKGGSVQIIWYELSDDESQNPIDEFLKINNGKIRLTDAELIKALFLQKHNFDYGEKEIKQIEIAMQWENIENTLHREDFWSCFSQQDEVEDNRINLILTLVYQNENDGKLPEEEGDLFRFFNKKFETGQGMLQHVIKNEWYKIISCFRQLENWYEDPITYNYIGLLSRYGLTVYEISKLYDALEDNATIDDFINSLKDKVKAYLKKVKINDDIIDLSYGDKNVKRVLLFLNVIQKNKQIENLRKRYEESDNCVNPIYKFPFDLLDSLKWDVEHIDSATTNALKRDDDKLEWIANAKAELSIQDGSDEILENLLISKKYDEAISYIRTEKAQEDDDPETKNWIGNLTLLDSSTNRSYGNSLFSNKKRIIEDRKKNGVFIPLCTEWVFSKSFRTSSKSLLTWNKEDKQAYHDFIKNEIEEFLK